MANCGTIFATCSVGCGICLVGCISFGGISFGLVGVGIGVYNTIAPGAGIFIKQFPGSGIVLLIISIIAIMIGCYFCYCAKSVYADRGLRNIDNGNDQSTCGASIAPRSEEIEMSSSHQANALTHIPSQLKNWRNITRQPERCISHSQIPSSRLGQNNQSSPTFRQEPRLPQYLQHELSSRSRYPIDSIIPNPGSDYPPTAPSSFEQNKTEEEDPPPTYHEALRLPYFNTLV